LKKKRVELFYLSTQESTYIRAASRAVVVEGEVGALPAMLMKVPQEKKLEVEVEVRKVK
jgi:hypothetical protein